MRLVAPASPFSPDEFARGVAELERLGLVPVFDDRVFERHGYVAGTAASRAAQLQEAWRDPSIDAVIGVRGGYGSVQLLPLMSPDDVVGHQPSTFIGYSDLTTLHAWLNCRVGVTSVHGPMLVGRLAAGTTAYSPESLLHATSTTPLGELRPDGLTSLHTGEASGPLLGGTLTQLLASLGTPWAFAPQADYVLLIDEVGERPYRLDRMCVQLRQSGLLERASAVVVGQLPGCDEPGGQVTGLSAVADALAGFPGPVLAGYPTGHAVSPLLSLPLGVQTRVVAGARPAVVVEESPVVAGG